MSEHCHHQLLICGCGLLDSTVIIHCIAIDQSCSILQFIQCSTTAGTANASGYSDTDYPVLGSSLPALGDMPLLGGVSHTSLPPELVTQFDSIQPVVKTNMFQE